MVGSAGAEAVEGEEQSERVEADADGAPVDEAGAALGAEEESRRTAEVVVGEVTAIVGAASHPRRRASAVAGARGRSVAECHEPIVDFR